MHLSRFPFAHLTKEEWQNLGITAIVIFYLLKILAEIFFNNTFMILGGDFLSFWSAGYVANTQGYEAAYDITEIGKIQYQYIPKPLNISNYQYIPLPTIFLPYFLLPFQVLARISLVPAFILWSLLNLLGYIGFLKWFCAKLNIHYDNRIKLLSVLFFPTFQSLYWGQIGLLLLIPIGEFFRSLICGKPYRAGAWLSLLLIKPQVLILIIPFFIITKQWKTVLGFILTSILIIITSFLLAGKDGMLSWLQLLNKVSSNQITSIGAKGMLNWKSLGLNVNDIFSTSIGNWIIFSGSLITILLLFIFLKKNYDRFSARTYLAIFSSTAVVSPHFHIHSAIIFIPFIIHLISNNRKFIKLLYSWVFVPPVILLIIDIIHLVIPLSQNPSAYYLVNFLIGVTCFILTFFTFLSSYES